MTAAAQEPDVLVPDAEATRLFCDVVFRGAEGLVPVRILSEKGGPSIRPSTPFVPLDAKLAARIFQHARSAARRAAALYVVPGTVIHSGSAAAQDIAQIATVLVDLDDGDIDGKREHLLEHLGEASLVVASGGETAEGQPRLHVYWRLTAPAAGSDLEPVCRLRAEIARKVGGDASFASAHQPVRVAGSIYAKHGIRRVVRILSGSERDVDLAAFAEAVATMPFFPGIVPDGAKHNGSVRTTARDLLTRTVREGRRDGVSRHEAITSVIGYWIRRARDGRVSLDEAWAEVAGYNDSLVRPPRPREDLRRDFERLHRLDERNHGGWPDGPSPLAGGATPPPLSEDALAATFTARHESDWRYVAAWGAWLGWDGVRWRPDDTCRRLDLVRGICREAAAKVDSQREARRLASHKTIVAVERIARSDPAHAARPDGWDPNPMQLNTRGGIIDLETGETHPHDRSALMTRTAGASPRGDCPRWLQFLDEVTNGNAALVAYLRRVAGYCLTGRTDEHAMLFLFGDGGNGKSVFVSVLAAILGDYATTAPLDTFMAGERHPTDLAGLRGARLVSVVETQEGRRWAESKIKAVTGGDAIKARFMRRDFFEFRPQFKLLVIGNHKPALRSVDEAIRRRLHLIPFRVTIPPGKRDRSLVDKLMAERDGILRWAIAGCADWLRDGLAPPKAVTDASTDYLEDEDTVADWLAERCLCEPAAFTASGDLFADWRAWAEAAGERSSSKKWLSGELVRRGFSRDRSTRGARGFAGLRLRPPEQAPQNEESRT